MNNEAQKISLMQQETCKELTEYLIRIFRHQDYSPTGFFHRAVFFLESDEEFHKIASGCSTLDATNPMHRMLANLSAEKTNFAKLKVPVDTFCEELACYLFSTYCYKAKAEKQIRKYNAEELKNVIEEKIKFLTANQDKKESSKLEIRLRDAKDLPDQNCTFKLVLKEVLQNREGEERDSKLLSLFEKQTEIDVIGIGKEAEFPEIPFEALSLDLEKSNKTGNKKFNGCSLSSFYLNICSEFGKTVLAESENEPFLNIIMAYVEKFCETSTNSFSIPWKLKCRSRVTSKNKEETEFNLNLVLRVTLDADTQIEILKRANLIFYSLITTKNEEELAINTLLECYFPESFQDISYILARSNEKRENCGGCTSCAII